MVAQEEVLASDSVRCRTQTLKIRQACFPYLFDHSETTWASARSTREDPILCKIEGTMEAKTMRLLIVSQAADTLRVCKETVRRLVRKGALPAFRVGRGWRFDLEEITEFARVHADLRAVACQLVQAQNEHTAAVNLYDDEVRNQNRREVLHELWVTKIAPLGMKVQALQDEFQALDDKRLQIRIKAAEFRFADRKSIKP